MGFFSPSLQTLLHVLRDEALSERTKELKPSLQGSFVSRARCLTIRFHAVVSIPIREATTILAQSRKCPRTIELGDAKVCTQYNCSTSTINFCKITHDTWSPGCIYLLKDIKFKIYNYF